MVRFFLQLALIAMPIAEIIVLILVGKAIGVLPTVLLVIASSVLGAVLLKRQGLSALTRLRTDLRENRVPAAAIGHAIVVAIAGVLLLLPGFITDIVGLLLFIPAVRRTMWRQIAGSVTIRTAGTGTGSGSPLSSRPFGSRNPGRGRNAPTIDLEATERRPVDGPSSSPSPWRDGGSR